jgi:hypothetical protein
VYWNRIAARRIPQYIRTPSLIILEGQYITRVNLSAEHSTVLAHLGKTRYSTSDEKWLSFSRAFGYHSNATHIISGTLRTFVGT